MTLHKTPPAGMRDLLPEDVLLREYLRSTIEKTYLSHGFQKIETPALEDIRNLQKGEGGENESLVFKVLKRGEKLRLDSAKNEGDLVDMGLRYDLTIPLSRYYLNNHHLLQRQFKALHIGPVWRGERPQKGRFRQFTQCDIDIIGIGDISAEIMLLSAAHEIIVSLGLKNFVFHLNDRRILKSMCDRVKIPALDQEKVLIILDKYDKIGLEGVEKELLSISVPSDSVKILKEILTDCSSPNFNLNNFDTKFPGVIEERIKRDIEYAMKVLHERGVRVKFDISLVRGMGYYTGAIFELKSDVLSYSIMGGGRYDNLIGKLNGKDTPACGISIGFERLFLLLQESGYTPLMPQKIAILMTESEKEIEIALKLSDILRRSNFITSIILSERNVSRQLSELKAQGYQYLLDVKSTIDMVDSTSYEFKTQELINYAQQL